MFGLCTGCYAQTELGHGSNVQGLETTATYQPDSKTFVLQSPGLTAMKWWIGGLGRTADHAVVMAQLHTPDGKNGSLVKRGPFPFVVPLRDVKTRELLPGRTIMDIGPKAGYPATDNGALLVSLDSSTFFLPDFRLTFLIASLPSWIARQG